MSNTASPIKTIIVIPTYNEAINLPKLIDIVLNLPIPALEVLVVDDGSPDGTGQIADNLSAQTGRVNVMHRQGKQGLGTAYIQGFTWALAHGAGRVVQMDADFSHNPEDVPRLLAKLDEYDLVIGSRYVKGGRLDEKWSAWRRLLSWWANRVWVGMILNTHIMDTTAGYRAWRAEALRGMGLERIKSNGYIFQVEMTYVAQRLGYRITEIPIYFAEREQGQSKMGFEVQLEAARGVFRVRRQYGRLTPADRAR